MHGAAVSLITGIYWLGILETITHFIIDHCKCKKLYDIHIDQLLHFICKAIWVVIWYYCK